MVVLLINKYNIYLLFVFYEFKDIWELKDKLVLLFKIDYLINLFLCVFLEDFIDCNMLKVGILGFYFVLLCVDLDYFWYINESLGYDCGDLLIKVVFECIFEVVWRDDLVGCMEGDEFVVVFIYIDILENVGMVVNKIIECVCEFFLIDGYEVFIGCLIGVSVYFICGDDVKIFFKNVEVFLVRVKVIGCNSY